jgi:hypothetical protein
MKLYGRGEGMKTWKEKRRTGNKEEQKGKKAEIEKLKEISERERM